MKILLLPSRSVNQMQHEKRQQEMSSQDAILHIASILKGHGGCFEVLKNTLEVIVLLSLFYRG